MSQKNKGEIDNSTIVFEDLRISLSIINTKIRQ